MTKSAEAVRPQPGLPREGPLWVGVLTPAVAWAIEEQIGMQLAPWICRTGNKAVVPLIAAVCLAFALAAGSLAARAWRALRTLPEEEPRVPVRQRFMALVGMMMSALFSLVIVASAIPGLIYRPCD